MSLSNASGGEASVLEIWGVLSHFFIAITPKPTLTWSGSLMGKMELF